MAASSPDTPNLRFLLPKNRWAIVALVLTLMAGALALGRWLQGRMEVVTIYVNDNPLTVEVANNPFSRAKGLQDRKILAPNAGMLFVFPEPQILRFWMKDTPLDLDIGFFDANDVSSIPLPWWRSTTGPNMLRVGWPNTRSK
jgi:hypothetical protein